MFSLHFASPGIMVNEQLRREQDSKTDETYFFGDDTLRPFVVKEGLGLGGQRFS